MPPVTWVLTLCLNLRVCCRASAHLRGELQQCQRQLQQSTVAEKHFNSTLPPHPSHPNLDPSAHQPSLYTCRHSPFHQSGRINPPPPPLHAADRMSLPLPGVKREPHLILNIRFHFSSRAGKCQTNTAGVVRGEGGGWVGLGHRCAYRKFVFSIFCRKISSKWRRPLEWGREGGAGGILWCRG